MVTLVGEMEITAEVEVCEGEMVTTPTPPNKTDRDYGAAFITVGKEVSLRRENGLIRGMGKTIFVRPYH